MASRGNPGRWIPRLLICLATAAIISVTAYLCAWLSARNIYSRTEEHARTRKDLDLLRKDVERHKEATGAWPARLTDLSAVKEKRVRVDEAGEPVDGWGRPLVYRIQPGGYQLFSFGADGMPGGVGKYADLFAGQADTWPERPTLAQFTALREAVPAQLACLLAGAVAFPLCLLEARGRRGERPSLGRFLLANAVTAVFAILAALMIGGLHTMPGGH
jgi:hypothetical protein